MQRTCQQFVCIPLPELPDQLRPRVSSRPAEIDANTIASPGPEHLGPWPRRLPCVTIMLSATPTALKRCVSAVTWTTPVHCRIGDFCASILLSSKYSLKLDSSSGATSTVCHKRALGTALAPLSLCRYLRGASDCFFRKTAMRFHGERDNHTQAGFICGQLS